EDVLCLLNSGADPSEIAARLRVAEPDTDAQVTWQLVAAQVTLPEAEDARAAAPRPTAVGRMTRTLLEEALADLPTEALVAVTGHAAVALVPDPADDVAAELRTRLAGLEGAAGEGIRLSLGVSAPVTRVDALRGALEEAWHAVRIAERREGAFQVVGHSELASHVALLAAAPESVRRGFRDRLLSPLSAYDARHQADLVTTLEAFLDCDGSWTRCAARLHVHVNTLRYRIGRIEELTNRDLSRLEDKVDFFLALRLR
ncbi:MAG: PucR family transcriptional regulator, partial [Streptomycetaceae bacterium]|nr:PucR family transcriptional regulator [Streptomycetaceae bacterium]